MNSKLPEQLNQNTWQTIDRNNAYFDFIANCRLKTYDGATDLHIHHIIPQYVLNKTEEGRRYLDSDENRVLLSPMDHLQAHTLLYEFYENKQDQGACLLLRGSMTDASQIWKRLGAEATHKIQKRKGGGIYSSEWQKEMAARSMARSDAIEIRSKGGKIGGTTRNLDRAIKQNERYLFKYKNQEVLCIMNCRTGGQVLEQLNLYQKTPLQRVTPLLNGDRKSLHGWSCVKLNSSTEKGISSQPTEGLSFF